MVCYTALLLWKSLWFTVLTSDTYDTASSSRYLPSSSSQSLDHYTRFDRSLALTTISHLSFFILSSMETNLYTSCRLARSSRIYWLERWPGRWPCSCCLDLYRRDRIRCMFIASFLILVALFPMHHQNANDGLLLQAFFVFCSFQAYLHIRASRGGAISLNWKRKRIIDARNLLMKLVDFFSFSSIRGRSDSGRCGSNSAEAPAFRMRRIAMSTI